MEEKDNESSNTEININLWNAKGNLIKNIIAISSTLLAVIFFVYPLLFGENDEIICSYKSVNIPYFHKLGSFEYTPIQKDSNGIIELNKYLKEKIPIDYLKYHDKRKRSLSVKERLLFEKITEKLSDLRDIFSDEHSMVGSYFGFITDMDGRRYNKYNYLAEITIFNQKREILENLEITISSPYVNKKYIPDGYYCTKYSFNLERFDGLNSIKIKEIKPEELLTLSLWTNGALDNYKLNLIYEGGSARIDNPITAMTTTKFDRYVTMFVLQNRIVQIILYVVVPICFLVLIWGIFRFGKFLLNIWNLKK